MLSLSDAQLEIVRAFAEPLDPEQRDAYLHRVAALLRGQELGDGSVSRAARMAQAELRRVPAQIDGRGNHGSKHAR
jgi:hypothetical protein